MSDRGTQLLQTADAQISELIGLFSGHDEAILSLPCPGREKLGDGTVAACALHSADRYQQIAGFLAATIQPSEPHAAGGQGGHRIPRPARGHAPRDHAQSRHDEGTHDDDYKAENVNLHGLVERLSDGRRALSVLADLTDQQLETLPPIGSFRFCDGQRTLEQVMAGLLHHQRHQLEALRAAVA